MTKSSFKYDTEVSAEDPKDRLLKDLKSIRFITNLQLLSTFSLKSFQINKHYDDKARAKENKRLKKYSNLGQINDYIKSDYFRSLKSKRESVLGTDPSSY